MLYIFSGFRPKWIIVLAVIANSTKHFVFFQTFFRADA